MYKYIICIIVVITSFTTPVLAETVKCWSGGYDIVHLVDVTIDGSRCTTCTSFAVIEKDGTRHILPISKCQIIQKSK